MILDYYDIEPLPTQQKIADEMNVTLFEGTYINYFTDVLERKNITVILCCGLPRNFTLSNKMLKNHIMQDRPIIVSMNYTLSNNSTGHFRVITGFNETGYFLHDPWYTKPYYGPNVFFNYSLFETLWAARNYEGLIIESSWFDHYVYIFDGGVSTSSTSIGKSEVIWFKAEYGFTFEDFNGSTGILYVNGEPMIWSTVDERWEKSYSFDKPTTINFQVSGIDDEKYGVTFFNNIVDPLSISWKKKGIFGLPVEFIIGLLAIIFIILLIFIE